MVAAEARTVDRPLALVAGAGRQPAAMTLACHALPALLPRMLPPRHAVWAHRHDGVADLILLDGRTLLTSRQVAAADPADLAREIRRTLPVVRWTDADDVWLSGLPDDEARAWRDRLTAALGVAAVAPRSPPPLCRSSPSCPRTTRARACWRWPSPRRHGARG
jgi:hypothetical protein